MTKQNGKQTMKILTATQNVCRNYLMSSEYPYKVSLLRVILERYNPCFFSAREHHSGPIEYMLERDRNTGEKNIHISGQQRF